MMACPHRNIVYCPLYVASHDPAIAAVGCCGRDWEMGCDIDQGASYSERLGRLMAADARFVAELKWREEAEESKAQRLRNMRAAGIFTA